MDHSDVERLRERHPAWRLLRAANAPLVLAFLGRHFVEGNQGATSISVLAVALDDELYALNAADPGAARYPKPAIDYLEDWAHPDAGWLRRFYPLGSTGWPTPLGDRAKVMGSDRFRSQFPARPRQDAVTRSQLASVSAAPRPACAHS